MTQTYMTALRTALGQLDTARQREVMAEISAHLEDKAHHLMLNGLSKEASMEKAMETLGDPTELGQKLKQVHDGVTRRDAWLAALPPMLFGLSITLPYVWLIPLGLLNIGGATALRPTPVFNTLLLFVVGIVLLNTLILIVGSLFAATRRLPVWSHTWTGAAVMVTTFILAVASDDLPYLISPMIDVLIILALMLLLGAALGIAGWRSLLTGGLAGLGAVMILSLGTVWAAQAAPFSRLDIALLAGPLGLTYGGLIYNFMTGDVARRATLLIIGGLLCLITMASVEYGVFWQWRVSYEQTGQIWTLLAVGLALLVFGPMVGLAAQRLRLQVE